MSDESAKLTSKQVCDLVQDHLDELLVTQPGKMGAFNFEAFKTVLAAIDAKTQQVLPVLDSLLPAQWDAIAKIIAAGIHAANTGINPPVVPVV